MIMAGVVSATEIASVLVKDFAVFAVLRALNGSTFPTIFAVSYVLSKLTTRIFINKVFNSTKTTKYKLNNIFIIHLYE